MGQESWSNSVGPRRTASILWRGTLARTSQMEPRGCQCGNSRTRILRKHGRRVRGTLKLERGADSPLGSDRSNAKSRLAPSHKKASIRFVNVTLGGRLAK